MSCKKCKMTRSVEEDVTHERWVEEQYYIAALVLCGNIWNIRINTVSLYTPVISEIYSRDISLFFL